MAQAASLSVSITGDASGLINSLNAADAALSGLSEKANGVISQFDGKNAKITITAVDNTAAGVSAAKANINSLHDKVVTVSVRYNVSNIPKMAGGTKNAPEGLAVINDEKGVSDPRELVEHNGRLIMYEGRDVIVPLSKGDKVYTASETKAIMSGLGLPHYASGWNNEYFETEKAELNHYKKTHNMSPAEELQWWNELMVQFAYDSMAVREIQEEIFSLQQEIWKEEKKASEESLADYKEHSDAWIKYQVEVGGMGVDEQIEAYKRQLYNYNAMVSQMVTSTEYSAEEIKGIWEDFYEYKAGVDLTIGKLEIEKQQQEQEEKHSIYEKWQSDAENWKMIRDTYGDWGEWNDSPVKFYERSIERIQEMYDAGNIGWQEYRDDTMYAILDLYNAKMDEADALLDYQKDYISNLKDSFEAEENALSEKWEVSDRKESKAEVQEQLDIYENAVTQKGKDKYNSLLDDMKQIKREEEMYNLQKAHTEKITELEESYDTVEKNKQYLLATIEKTGFNIEDIIGTVNSDIKGMESTITTLFMQTINAIKSINVSSNSYSDNRNINITGDASDILNALQNRVGLAVSAY